MSRFNDKSDRNVIYLSRFNDNPDYNVIYPSRFNDKSDRNSVYSCWKEGLKKSNLVVTEDSDSRVAGEEPREVSGKLNFSKLLEQYRNYKVAQELYNKMVKAL